MGDIILSTAAQQYGGFTVPEVDKILAPYAQKSYDKYIQEFMKYSDESWTGREERAIEYALDKVRRAEYSRIFQRGLSICNCNSWTWNKAVREDGKYFSS